MCSIDACATCPTGTNLDNHVQALLSISPASFKHHSQHRSRVRKCPLVFIEDLPTIILASFIASFESPQFLELYRFAQHHSTIVQASFESRHIWNCPEDWPSIVLPSFKHRSIVRYFGIVLRICPASFYHRSSIVQASFESPQIWNCRGFYQHRSTIVRESFKHRSTIVQASFESPQIWNCRGFAHHRSTIIQASFIASFQSPLI